ncbi:MAG: NrdH-redoxin [Candidatus Levybacteria bacterium]|nr:NrdH-redoxin [Candidatus Levybacteria bacterium]
MSSKHIKFYGADWCADCHRSRFFLDQRGVMYEYINIDKDPSAAAEVEEINRGMQSIPTILFPNGEVLVEPSNEELKKALDANKNLIIMHKDKMKAGDRNG